MGLKSWSFALQHKNTDKIETRISQDPVGYENAIEAFTKSFGKLANTNDATIQNTLQK